MEAKNNNYNIILIVAAIIIVAGVSIVVGINIGNSTKNTNTTTEKAEQNANEEQKATNTLDNDTALTLVQYLYDDAMDFYTFKAIDNCIWKDDNDSCINLSQFWQTNPDGGFIKIDNYLEVMNNVFTTNGINQFEDFMKNDISNTPFIKKEGNNTYVLAPTSGFYTGYTTSNLQVKNIEENIITATIDVVDAFAQSEGEENYKVTKNITIKKENNKWLMDEFAIPMITEQ